MQSEEDIELEDEWERDEWDNEPITVREYLALGRAILAKAELNEQSKAS